MTIKELLASKWMRIVVFLWLIAFPLIFIVGPLVEMMVEEEAEKSWTPVWALVVWMLGPWAASIVLKYSGARNGGKSDES